VSTIARPRATDRKKTESGLAPVAVIDIGSNSVRLVAFAGLSRNPVAIFNEKVLAGLGRNIVSTGKLDADGVRRAFKALRRFRAVIERHDIEDIHAVATAAVREAENGAKFVAEAAKICGASVRVLAGEEEAKLTALGVLSGIPDAEGLVGDLGGGSLELLAVEGGRVTQAATAPLGALRLLDESKGKVAVARDIVAEVLAQIPWLRELKSNSFYAVGGAWRTLARIQMANASYGLQVLQHHVIPRDEAFDLAHLVSSLSRKSLLQISQVPSRRVESLPFAAVVLEHLLRLGKLKTMVVSAYGLREGILFDLLPESVKRQDPLIEGCREMAHRMCRVPGLGAELFDWMSPLFLQAGAPESEDDRRLREAACWLSGIAWRANPDHRGQIGFREAVYAPLGGISHRQRFFLGLTVMRRYDLAASPEIAGRVPSLSEDEDRRASTIGLALRLGVSACGAAAGILRECPISLTDREIVLRFSPRRAALAGEVVQKRLSTLAAHLGRAPLLIAGAA